MRQLRLVGFVVVGVAGVVWGVTPTLLQALGNFLVVRDPLVPVDAAIAISGDGTGERVRAAAALVVRGDADWLIISGSTAGAAPGGATAAMVRVALASGVPPARVLVDDQSTSTGDNARHSAALMVARHLRRAVLVTSPYHTRRAAWVFRSEFRWHGLQVSVLATPDSFFHVDRWWTRPGDRRLVVREYMKLAAFLIGVR